MAKKARAPNPFTGRWRITWMDQWDQDFVDAEVEGFFESARTISARFSSATSRETSTTGRAFETGSQASSSPGRGMTKWTPHKVEVGQSSTVRRSTA